MLRNKIEEFCESLGLDTIGFIPCRRFDESTEFFQNRKDQGLENEFEEHNIEKRVNPFLYMEDGKTIISIAFPYNPADKETVDNGFSVYTKRYDYHRVVKSYLLKICKYIEELGGNALYFVDSNNLPERYLAYLAGVGFIGRNNMLITEKYGTYVFLGEIITNLEIECSDVRHHSEIRRYNECGDCNVCYRACPSKSITNEKINPNICLSYYTQKKELQDDEMKILKGNVFGCDICQQVCRYNKPAVPSTLPEFKTLEFMNEDVSTYAAMDNKMFKEKVSLASCGWRGKNVIKRNALIHLSKKGEDIKRYRQDSPYINEYIDRLNELFCSEVNDEDKQV
jgi:epoxyqueuosine reductase